MNLPAPDPAFRWTVEPWGAALRCAPLEAIAQHAFTSKQLQLPDPGGWGAAAASVGGTADRLRRVKQVHGNLVRDRRPRTMPVTPRPGPMATPWCRTCRAWCWRSWWPTACQSSSPIARAARPAPFTPAGAAPARAWDRPRLSMMRERFGTEPSDLVAAIGPSIGPDDYEVGESLVEAFQQAGHAAGDLARWFERRDSRLLLDLWAANRDQLIDGRACGPTASSAAASARWPTPRFSIRSGRRARPPDG